MILRLSLELPEDLAYIKITRILGRALLEHLQADPTDINDIEILVGELCSNVLRHAQSHDALFHVVLEYFSDHVRIMVEDRGRGFSVQRRPPGRHQPGGLRGRRADRRLRHDADREALRSSGIPADRPARHDPSVPRRSSTTARRMAAAAADRLNKSEGQAQVTTAKETPNPCD